ncbi:MAG TPA: DUF6655 family protein [Lacipirellulaceae bacterium]|nr:DUF6655 family protein [Lacipirellulaceae bacterium]
MVAASLTGCGTTRSTDTTRTATEQLLISDAIDRAVQSMNLKPLAGQTVFVDDTKVSDVVDKNYYISTLRQQLLASGCDLRDKREDADFIVEARAGAIGTDRNDLLFGVPATNVPQIPLVQPVPAAIPEIPIAKRKDQRGVAKIAVFAYHRATGTPVWQSGIVCQESSSNDVWIFGAGPFQHGTIYEGTEFAGGPVRADGPEGAPNSRRNSAVALSKESLFTPPGSLPKQMTPPASATVQLAAHQEAGPAAAKPASPPATTTPPATSNATAGQTAVPPAPTPPAVNPAVASSKPLPTSAPAIPAVAGVLSPAANVGINTPLNCAFAKSTDPNPLPQPRFNSPQ